MGSSNLLVNFLENMIRHPCLVLPRRSKVSYDQVAGHDMHSAAWGGHHVVLWPKFVEPPLVFTIGERPRFDCLSIPHSDAL